MDIIYAHDIINILITLLIIGVIITIIRKPKREKYEIFYILNLISMAIWPISLILFNHPILFNSTEWLRIVYVISLLYQMLTLVFVSKFPKEIYVKGYKPILIIGILFSILFSGLTIFTDKIVISTIWNTDKNVMVSEMGEYYKYFNLFDQFIVFATFYIALAKNKKLEGRERAQVNFFLLANLITGILIMLMVVALPMLTGDTSLFSYTPVCTIPYFVIVSYSILKYRFFDIKYLFVELIYYISLSTIIFLTFFGLVDVQTHIFKSNVHSPTSHLVAILLALILAFVINVFLQKFKQFLYRTLLKEQQTLGEQYDEYANTLSKRLSVSEILEETSKYLLSPINAKNLEIYVRSNSNHQISFTKDSNNLPILWDSRFEKIAKIYQDYLMNQKVFLFEKLAKPLIFNHAQQIEMSNFMESNHIAGLIPITIDDEIEGFVALEGKINKSTYTIQELEYINRISTSMRLALEKAFFYEQLQTFNNTLQSKVNEQTKELQIKVKELEEARRKEADMIDIMGHELRTPATIVKLNASFLTKFVNEIDSNPEGYKKYVNRIQEAIENEIKLINTLLSSAKLEGDKIELNPEEIDIQKEIEMSLHGHETLAQGKNLKVINQTALNTPNIYADKARLVEVLNNLISNAIKYTEKGGIMVKTTFNDQYVKVSIIDTGNGIPKQDLPKLGQKFYRISNYINKGDQSKEIVRPGGTGLGLYVTFNLVRKMGGDIWVESEVGKGSIFSFTIPRYNNQIPSTTADNSTNMFERLGLKK